MKTLKPAKTFLNEYLNYEIIGMYCKSIETDPNTLHISEHIIHKPHLLIHNNNELFCLNFSANSTIKNKLTFRIRKVKAENINQCESILKIGGILKKVKTNLNNTHQQIIFETSSINFVIAVDCRFSKEKIIFYYQEKY